MVVASRILCDRNIRRAVRPELLYEHIIRAHKALFKQITDRLILAKKTANWQF
jgi:hypothetical protein